VALSTTGAPRSIADIDRAGARNARRVNRQKRERGGDVSPEVQTVRPGAVMVPGAGDARGEEIEERERLFRHLARTPPPLPRSPCVICVNAFLTRFS